MFSFEGMIYRAENGIFETDKKDLSDFLKSNINWKEIKSEVKAEAKKESKPKKESKKQKEED